jgi:hypothetical protein
MRLIAFLYLTLAGLAGGTGPSYPTSTNLPAERWDAPVRHQQIQKPLVPEKI